MKVFTFVHVLFFESSHLKIVCTQTKEPDCLTSKIVAKSLEKTFSRLFDCRHSLIQFELDAYFVFSTEPISLGASDKRKRKREVNGEG